EKLLVPATAPLIAEQSSCYITKLRKAPQTTKHAPAFFVTCRAFLDDRTRSLRRFRRWLASAHPEPAAQPPEQQHERQPDRRPDHQHDRDVRQPLAQLD